MRMETFEKTNVSLNNVIFSDSRSSRSRMPSTISLEIAASAPVPKSITKSTPKPSPLPPTPSTIINTPAPVSKNKNSNSIKKVKQDSAIPDDVQAWRLAISSKPLANSAVIYLKKQKRDAIVEETSTAPPVEEKKRNKSKNKVNEEVSKIINESTCVFNIKDEVIVDDGYNEVFVARVLDYNPEDNEYLLHYLGWSSKSDKWVPRNRLLKRTLYDMDNEI